MITITSDVQVENSCHHYDDKFKEIYGCLSTYMCDKYDSLRKSLNLAQPIIRKDSSAVFEKSPSSHWVGQTWQSHCNVDNNKSIFI